MRKMPSQQILLCFIFLSNLSSRVLLYFSLPFFFFASLGQFFVLPAACEKGNTQQQQHCSPAEQRRAVPALLGPSPTVHHGEERRNQREENSLKLSEERRSEWSCHSATLHLLPLCWERFRLTARRGNNINSFSSQRNTDPLLQAKDHPERKT